MEYFLRKYGQENGREGLHFSAAAMKRLMDYNWPGNVIPLSTLNQKIRRLQIEMKRPREEPLLSPRPVFGLAATTKLFCPPCIELGKGFGLDIPM